MKERLERIEIFLSDYAYVVVTGFLAAILISVFAYIFTVGQDLREAQELIQIQANEMLALELQVDQLEANNQAISEAYNEAQNDLYFIDQVLNQITYEEILYNADGVYLWLQIAQQVKGAEE